MFLDDTPQGNQGRCLNLFIVVISDSLRRKDASRQTFIAPLFDVTLRHSQ
jgi:hypothetical protein